MVEMLEILALEVIDIFLICHDSGFIQRFYFIFGEAGTSV